MEHVMTHEEFLRSLPSEPIDKLIDMSGDRIMYYAVNVSLLGKDIECSHFISWNRRGGGAGSRTSMKGPKHEVIRKFDKAVEDPGELADAFSEMMPFVLII